MGALHGDFIPLRDVLDEMATCYRISDEELDAFIGPANKDPNPYIEMSRRARYRRLLARGASAGRLLDLVNKPLGTRPEWYEAEDGYWLPANEVGREGSKLLIGFRKAALWERPATLSNLNLAVEGDLPHALWQLPERMAEMDSIEQGG